MSIDRRFALIAENGDVLFPYRKLQEATGRTGFALSTRDDRDRKGGAGYTAELAEVIRRVVLHGDAVRARTDGKSSPERDGSIGLGKKAAHKFYVAPEFEQLVIGSAFERVSSLPTQRRERRTGGAHLSLPRDPLSEIALLVVEDFVEALRANDDELTDPQRAMLAAHYAAPGHLQSVRKLADAAGLDSEVSASVEYGKVGRMVATDAGISSPGSWIQFLATASAPNANDGETGWVMREPLARALEELGLVEPVTSSLVASVAKAELASESGFNDLSDTEKQALVNARIGQGSFRRRMLKLWGGRCAVTGCAIGEVLTASHAWPWAESSNEARLDEFNGLPLAATLDRLFDRGLIGFADDGRIVKSKTLQWTELAILAITPETKLRTIHARNIRYLQLHRAKNGLDVVQE